MEKKTVYMQVDYHQSGRFTLKEKEKESDHWRDVDEPGLFANLDAAVFYQKLAHRLASY